MEERRPRRRSSDQMRPDDISSSSSSAKVCMLQPRNSNIKKVQVVYYLSRNGQLEHPHYMEVSHLSNHHLRLRDVLDRLTVLRGKGMPSLYSWSCKRSYKNGYVWNDLSENDVIYPTDGAEYVLKGSELLEGSSERVHQLPGISNNNGNREIQEPNNFRSKRIELQETHSHPTKYTFNQEDHDQEESQEEYEDEEKTSYTSSTTPHSRCSIGVSTDELVLEEPNIEKTPTTESTHHKSPTLTPSVQLTEKPRNQITTTPTTSQRFEDGDPLPTELAPGRNSVLLQLIACGNFGVEKVKNNLPNRNSNSNYAIKGSESDLHKGVLYKSAVKVRVGGEEEEMIRYMSENPRFGNLQSEEKEYFSGSIVETMSENRVADEPASSLKRSNSYNEERSVVRVETEETVKEVAVKERSGGRCIPLKSLLSTKK